MAESKAMSVRAAAPRWSPAAACGVALLVALLWSFWPTLAQLYARWSNDERYSHGFLVVPFAAFLLWYRRGMLGTEPLRPAAWGLVLVGLGAALHLAGTYLFVAWFEQLALLPMVAGLVAVVGGWRALRWAWPAVAFLFFMIPLPYRLEVALGGPLQKIATRASTYALQTLGLPAVAEGVTIHLEGMELRIAEACNGLGMLMMFVAYAFAVALVIQRPLLDRALILLSAFPIAVLANVIRISLTGVLQVLFGSKVAFAAYHDLAGWLMMPVALVLLLATLKLISLVLVEPAPEERASADVMALARAGLPGGGEASASLAGAARAVVQPAK